MLEEVLPVLNHSMAKSITLDSSTFRYGLKNHSSSLNSYQLGLFMPLAWKEGRYLSRQVIDAVNANASLCNVCLR
jgi:hypothetical protein